MTIEKCGEHIASRGFDGERLRCSFNARFTMSKGVQRREVCLKHMRLLRAAGWERAT